MSNWTFEDRARLEREAMAAGNENLLGRIWCGDEFEPSLSVKPFGLTTLFVRTKEEKREYRERVLRIFAERDAIKARWAAQP